ncbi:MAG TPA: NAD(P)-dependent oxidoreductase [Phaeodactylibacter sp.]|nr:NAD(P)-dependent oxidoreductase [Phaeodactylibacter sp.]
MEKISQQEIEVIILRVGYFTGKNYALGLLPILLPRLKTHLVPWIENGKTTLPLINGADIGLAFRLSASVELKVSFNIVDIVGKNTPTVREVFNYLHEKYNYPLPHFSVSFRFAYAFARFVRWIYHVIPSDPLIVPAIVLLLEETYATNEKAGKLLGYHPEIHWKKSIDMQIEEMKVKQISNMKMNKEK